MKSDKTADNYKLESSYTSKSGLKVRSYVPFYNSEDRKFFYTRGDNEILFKNLRKDKTMI